MHENHTPSRIPDGNRSEDEQCQNMRSIERWFDLSEDCASSISNPGQEEVYQSHAGTPVGIETLPSESSFSGPVTTFYANDLEGEAEQRYDHFWDIHWGHDSWFVDSPVDEIKRGYVVDPTDRAKWHNI
ncbi:hypothetical protein, partial [Haloferax profundi]|uniref:hypothetical protein n=1 Tax=Haloferax profundi TaxID=1544718 RepID=UPI000AC503E8